MSYTLEQAEAMRTLGYYIITDKLGTVVLDLTIDPIEAIHILNIGQNEHGLPSRKLYGPLKKEPKWTCA